VTVDELARLTGSTPLADKREDELRQVILALGRLTYAQAMEDAFRELESLLTA
jgi:hypothetical protein